MQPTPTAPRKSPADAAASLNPDINQPLSGGDTPLTKTEPTSGPAGSSYQDDQLKGKDGIQAVLDSGKQAIDKSKEWLVSQDLASKAKDLGTKAADSFNGLTTTQKALGIGLLTAGIAFLLTRGGRKSKDGEYRKRPQRSPFDHGKPYDKDKNADGYGQGGRRPWGSNRYSASGPATGKPRVSSGSGYTSSAPGNGPRRDQGPTSGSRYDVNTSGSQNPNNLDGLSSAY